MKKLFIIRFLLVVCISFPYAANSQTVSGGQLPETVTFFLQDMLKASGNSKAIVTSRKRTPAKQAEILEGIYQTSGLVAAKIRYGDAGDNALDAIHANRQGTRQDRIDAATESITAFIAENGVNREELMHVIPMPHHTFDIAPSQLSNVGALASVLEQSDDVARVIRPGLAEKALHIEVKKTTQGPRAEYIGKCAQGADSIPVTISLVRNNISWQGRLNGMSDGVPITSIKINRLNRKFTSKLGGANFNGSFNSTYKTLIVSVQGTPTVCTVNVS